MNKKFLVFFISIGIMIITIFPAMPYDSATFPAMLGGYKVLVTFPPGATACTGSKTTRIVLQATQTTAREYLKTSQAQLLKQDLYRLPNWGVMNYQISVVSPKATVEKILQNNEDWNRSIERSHCVRLSPLEVGSDEQEWSYATEQPGRAVFENLDADNFSSAFLNNVFTNTDKLIQNGFWFHETTGYVIWTNEMAGYPETSYQAQILDDVPYVAGNQYWFVIAYGFEMWQLCQYDTSDIETYICIPDYTTTGDNLKNDFSTGIWFENFNTSSAWADNFPDLEIQLVEIYINGFNNVLLNQHIHTSHSCGTPPPPIYPPGSAMSGSIENGGTGYFIPEYLPLQCP